MLFVTDECSWKYIWIHQNIVTAHFHCPPIIQVDNVETFTDETVNRFNKLLITI